MTRQPVSQINLPNPQYQDSVSPKANPPPSTFPLTFSFFTCFPLFSKSSMPVYVRNTSLLIFVCNLSTLFYVSNTSVPVYVSNTNVLIFVALLET